MLFGAGRTSLDHFQTGGGAVPAAQGFLSATYTNAAAMPMLPHGSGRDGGWQQW